MIVGVAGKYCSGKTTVTACLIEKGFTKIDLDVLGHKALEESSSLVIQRFGESILDETGRIDRKELGRIVFKSRKKRRLLEEILHPRMVEMARAAVSGRTVIDGALLFYMGLDRLCDAAFWVTTPFCIRLHRALKRDRLSLFILLRRFSAQRDLTPQPSSNDVDIYYIRNTGSPAELKERLDRILP